MSKVDMSEQAQAERLQIMDRSKRQRTAKKVVVDLLDDPYEVESVRLGRGTASGWLYIRTQTLVPHSVRALVERQLQKHITVHRFYDDFSDPQNCISWSYSSV